MTDTPAAPLSTDERLAALRALVAQGLVFHDVVTVFGESAETNRHVAYARENLVREGEIEVDEIAVVSDGADDGVYCMAWVWVSDEDAGVERADDDQILEAEPG